MRYCDLSARGFEILDSLGRKFRERVMSSLCPPSTKNVTDPVQGPLSLESTTFLKFAFYHAVVFVDCMYFVSLEPKTKAPLFVAFVNWSTVVGIL